MECKRNLDKFTVSSSIGNGELTYPVGLITSDEVMYAGGYGVNSNNTFYLYTGDNFWFMSPSGMSNAEAGGMILSSFGQLSSALVSFTYYIRPVISLKASDIDKFFHRLRNHG